MTQMVPDTNPEKESADYTDYADDTHCRTGAAEVKCHPDAGEGSRPTLTNRR